MVHLTSAIIYTRYVREEHTEVFRTEQRDVREAMAVRQNTLPGVLASIKGLGVRLIVSMEEGMCIALIAIVH